MQAHNAHIEFHFWLGEYVYAKIGDPLSTSFIFGHTC